MKNEMTVTSQQVAERAINVLKARGEGRAIHFDASKNRLIIGDPGSWVNFAFLGHAEEEMQDAPESEKDLILTRRFWSIVRRKSDATKQELLQSLLPRIRDRAFFSALQRQAELELGADEALINQVILPHVPLNAALASHLAFELPTSMMEVGADRLQQWSVTIDQLMPIAISNLRARSSEPFEEVEAGIYRSAWHDTFDASRMLLPELFRDLKVSGAPVVLAPTHDVLLVTGDQNELGLAKIADWAEEAVMEPRSHSGIAFRLEDGQWKPWLPPRNHAAFPKLRLLELQTVASEYARQKEILDTLLQANHRPIGVATLRAFRSPEGELFTSSVWVEGMSTLLPKTDRIDFIRVPPGGTPENGKVWSITWEVAAETVPGLMQTTGDLPERWMVSGFPTEEQLEQMNKRSAPIV